MFPKQSLGEQREQRHNIAGIVGKRDWPGNVRTNTAYFITLLKTSLFQLAFKGRTQGPVNKAEYGEVRKDKKDLALR